MDSFAPALFVLAIFLVAMLYASVGHAGATGYIAVMTLAGIAPEVIRPTALSLNVVVAGIAAVQFFRAGHFRAAVFWPLVAASVPLAAVGGAIRLPTHAFEGLLGVVLAVSAARIVVEAFGSPSAADAPHDVPPARPLARPVLAMLGGAVGLLSGLTGVGGGVFLTPVLLWLEAAPVRQIAALTAPFILVNSLAGLAGGLAAGRAMPAAGAWLVAAVVAGATVGSQFGAFRFPARTLRLLMAVVLAFASAKLLTTAIPATLGSFPFR